ncbi:MAG: GDSL-type esterase/lipase family protein [Bauldia sp.]
MAGAAPIHIAAFGDSNTAAFMVGEDKGYPADLEKLLRARGYDVVITNGGVSGAESADGVRSVDTLVPPGTDIAIVFFGRNDKTLGRQRGRDARQHRHDPDAAEGAPHRGAPRRILGLRFLRHRQGARGGVLPAILRRRGGEQREAAAIQAGIRPAAAPQCRRLRGGRRAHRPGGGGADPPGRGRGASSARDFAARLRGAASRRVSRPSRRCGHRHS